LTYGIVRGNLVYFLPFWYFVPWKIWQPSSAYKKVILVNKKSAKKVPFFRAKELFYRRRLPIKESIGISLNLSMSTTMVDKIKTGLTHFFLDDPNNNRPLIRKLFNNS
jgi:hypothetical protein